MFKNSYSKLQCHLKVLGGGWLGSDNWGKLTELLLTPSLVNQVSVACWLGLPCIGLHLIQLDTADCGEKVLQCPAFTVLLLLRTVSEVVGHVWRWQDCRDKTMTQCPHWSCPNTQFSSVCSSPTGSSVQDQERHMQRQPGVPARRRGCNQVCMHACIHACVSFDVLSVVTVSQLPVVTNGLSVLLPQKLHLRTD